MNKKRTGNPKRRRLSSRLFFAQRKTSPLNQMEQIPFKDVELLKDYITDRGRILPKRITGANAQAQRNLKIAIKRARHLALLSFSEGHISQNPPKPISKESETSYKPFKKAEPPTTSPDSAAQTKSKPNHSYSKPLIH